MHRSYSQIFISPLLPVAMIKMTVGISPVGVTKLSLFVMSDK